MIGRTSRRARLGIATAVLVGGSAIGVAAVATSSHDTATAVKPAGFTLNFSHPISEQQALSSALSTWATSQQRSLSTLAQMAPMRTFSQTWHHNTRFAAQRGIVVLATKRFLLVRSANGGLHLWWLNGRTQFANVSGTTTGMTALTGNTQAAQQAMTAGNMNPASTVVAGGTAVVNQMAAPVAKPTTITVQSGNSTVTITITQTTATVAQAAPTTTGMATTKATQPVFTATRHVARDDLVFVAGVRTHGFLIAKLVLFAAPATTATPTPSATASVTQAATPTATPTGTPSATPTAGATTAPVPSVSSTPTMVSGSHM